MRCPELHTAALSFAALSTVLLVGCPTTDPDPPVERDPFSLVEADAWVRVTDPNDDVFADQRPADAVCDDSGYFFDPLSQTLEIQTEICDYLTLGQPTLEPLAPGDVVTVYAFHDVLTADQPAQGYLGLALDGQIEWEHTVPIPSDFGSIEEQFTIDRDLPAGTPVQFHVHNHGPNTWELLAVLVTPAPAQ